VPYSLLVGWAIVRLTPFRVGNLLSMLCVKVLVQHEDLIKQDVESSFLGSSCLLLLDIHAVLH